MKCSEWKLTLILFVTFIAIVAATSEVIQNVEEQTPERVRRSGNNFMKLKFVE
jgi:hypothetical protein